MPATKKKAPKRVSRRRRAIRAPARTRGASRGPGGRRAAAGRSAARNAGNQGLRCPDCDFVARHPMGLGRHRSTRHGVISQRQARRESAGAWITRREAARRAGVHYNTIRLWERAGKVRSMRRPGGRDSLINANDLARASARGPAGAAQDSERVRALERRLDALLKGLERLVSTARGAGRVQPRARRG